MVAIDEGNREVVITILSDEAQGLEAMRVCVEKPRLCEDDEGETQIEITTPMRMLIEEMQDVAEWMMNRSIYCCSGDQGEESGESPVVEYSFQFLEDFQEEKYRLPLLTASASSLLGLRIGSDRTRYTSPVPGPVSLDLGNGKEETGDEGGKKPEEVESALVTTTTTPVATVTIQATAKEMDNIFEHSSSGTSGPSGMPDEVAEAEGLLTNPGHTTTNKWGPILYNRDHHPLHIMVKHKRAELLRHPLVSRLLEYKWRKVALPLFLAYIALYILFLLLLTLFAILSPRPSPSGDTCVLEFHDSGTNANKTNGTCNGLKESTESYLRGSAVFLILLSLFYLSIETVQVLRRRKQYLTEGENYIQVLTFLFSMIFVSGFGNECWCAPSWQWQFGALALFLAWFNLVILLKDMPFTGIPINMLFNICLTFVGLVFLPVLLIISFALPFYMLFVRDVESVDGDVGPLTAFWNPARAIAKTVMQTVGELDFETIFNDGNLLYSPTAYLLFFTFVVIMPVLFSNLLVGLAVGDTAEEKEKATFTRTRLQVEFILELEAMSVFLRGQMRPPDNRRRNWKKMSRIRKMYLSMMGLSYRTQVELVKELREKDEDFIDSALKEKGPTHELQMKVEGLGVKTVKVDEDVRVMREEVGGVERKLGDRLQAVEKSLSELKVLLEQLVKSMTASREE
ncbi:Transient receptor potential cation channel subfamily A member 1 homolog [Geodia barretti]|nr:Transient receptor potential cation channel subfamily A member 1 homolog [Geodia barretti]